MQKTLKMVGAQLPRDLDERARVKAAYLDISKSEFIRRALEHYLQFLERPNEENQTEGNN